MVWTIYGEREKKYLETAMKNFEDNWNNLVGNKKALARDKKISTISMAIIPASILLWIIGINLRIPIPFPLLLFTIIAAAGAFAFIKHKYASKSKDFLKIELAREKGWFYSPEKSKADRNQLANKFPSLFRKGNNNNRYIEDQFYGNIEVENEKVPFHMGNFFYEVEVRTKNGKNHHPHYHHFFAFRLKKDLGYSLAVKPEGMFSKIGNVFTKKDFNVESIEFNKQFSFGYSGNKIEMKRNITKLFTPSLQLAFIELDKTKKDFTVVFKNNEVVFMFDQFLMPKIKTNILKSEKIDERDKKELNQKISIISKLMKEIMKSVY